MKKLGLVAVVAVMAAAIWWIASQGHLRQSDDRLLSYVPADSAFVLAMTKPLPEDVTQSYLDLSEQFVGLYGQMLQPLIDQLQQSDKPEDARIRAVVEALRAEFADKSLRQSIEDLGLSLRGRSAIYAIGLVPVLRIELQDPRKFEAFVARMESAAGAPLPRAKVDQVEYWKLQAPDTPLMLVGALIESQLVISLAPGNADPLALRGVLGLDRPAQSLADSGGLQALNKEFGLLPFASGYLDSGRLLAQFSGDSSPLEQSFLSAMEIDKPSLDPVCQSELDGIAKAWPRLVFGYTRYDSRANDMLMVIETRKDIAESLMKLRAPLPGAGAASEQALINFGLALRLSAVPGVVDSFANQVAQSPFQCEQLVALNQAFSEARKGINNPGLYGVAPLFNAFHLLVDKLDLSALNQGNGQPDGEVRLAIGSDNPASLLGMARSFVPPLANLQVPTDGTPVALPAMPGMPAELQPQVASSGKVLALSSHAAGGAELADLLSVDEGRQPLLLIGLRSEVYAQFADAMERSLRASMESSEASALDPELDESAQLAAAAERAEQRQQAEAMLEMQMKLMREIYPKMFARTETRIEFTARGIEWHQLTTMP